MKLTQRFRHRYPSAPERAKLKRIKSPGCAPSKLALVRVNEADLKARADEGPAASQVTGVAAWFVSHLHHSTQQGRRRAGWLGVVYKRVCDGLRHRLRLQDLQSKELADATVRVATVSTKPRDDDADEVPWLGAVEVRVGERLI
jgi:hypothetical protein